MKFSLCVITSYSIHYTKLYEYSAPAPRELDASRASGLPASRLPVIGGYFRRELVPPPDERGAPVYAIGDAMALDLRQFRPEDFV